MKYIITIFTLILYIVYVTSIYYRLNSFDYKKRIIYILAGTIFMYLITLIIVNTTSLVDIEGFYENEQVILKTRQILRLIFTPINGLIILPYTAKLLSGYNNKEIKLEELKKKMIIILIIFFIILIIEKGYIKDMQIGTLNMLNINNS